MGGVGTCWPWRTWRKTAVDRLVKPCTDICSCSIIPFHTKVWQWPAGWHGRWRDRCRGRSRTPCHSCWRVTVKCPSVCLGNSVSTGRSRSACYDRCWRRRICRFRTPVCFFRNAAVDYYSVIVLYSISTGRSWDASRPGGYRRSYCRI